jgi:hypothetical protein
MPFKHIPFRRWISVTLPVFVIGLLIVVLVPFIHRARETARRTLIKNTMHQFGIALSIYHEVFSAMPPGSIVGSDGTAFHGWTYSLLPYLDSSPVFIMIDPNVPWDDPRNEAIFRLHYTSYLREGLPEATEREGYGLTHFDVNPHLFHRNSSVSYDDMSAGRGATWMAGTAAGHYQPWGYPFNWRPLGDRLNSGPDSYGRAETNTTEFVFADGRVRTASHDTDASILRKWAEAPPVPSAEAMQKPPRPTQYRWSGRTEIDWPADPRRMP